MNKRQKIKNTLLQQQTESWKESVYMKIVFRKSTKVVNYWNVANVIAFCDAMSILFVSYVDKFIHYFDIDRKFDR
jgi:hypothetical protein